MLFLAQEENGGSGLIEVVIVVSIQAYIFAALSAIYIGSAIEPEH